MMVVISEMNYHSIVRTFTVRILSVLMDKRSTNLLKSQIYGHVKTFN